ncbi:protein rolling stone-like [Neocloeon triangulifer]|uniref:protein rolling stone-like n=1 Tax=Neocloeon triangulifer TaxID=2078957 RepID=UPI00286F9D96|nr:protein rolling stone-like [Neocloeon triangulifer]
MGSFCIDFHREFKLENALLAHNNAANFAQCRLSRSNTRRIRISKIYLSYRLAVPIFLIAGILWDLIGIADKKCKVPIGLCRAMWPIYLTNWNTLILAMNTSLAAMLVLKDQRADNMQVSCIEKFYWVLKNLSIGLSPLVSLMYWTLEYKPEVHPLDFSNVRDHILNTVIVLVDLLVCAHPIRLLHIYQPMLLGLVYPAFTAIYHYMFHGVNRNGKKYIYETMDWGNPTKVLIVAAAAILFEGFVFFAMWFLYFNTKRCFVRDEQDEYEMTETSDAAEGNTQIAV